MHNTCIVIKKNSGDNQTIPIIISRFIVVFLILVIILLQKYIKQSKKLMTLLIRFNINF